jgi:hypothetical protein
MAAASRAAHTRARIQRTRAPPSTPRAATGRRRPAPSTTSPGPGRPKAFSATATATSRETHTRRQPSGRATPARARARPRAPALATTWTTGSPWPAVAPTRPATCSGSARKRTGPRARTNAGDDAPDGRRSRRASHCVRLGTPRLSRHGVREMTQRGLRLALLRRVSQSLFTVRAV